NEYVRHRRHSYGVGYQSLQHSNLGARLERRTIETRVHTFLESNFQPGCDCMKQGPKLAMVRVTHIRKSRVAFLKRSNKRIGECEIQMILDDHQITGAEITPNSASRIRREQGSGAEFVQYSHRKSGERRRMSFVHVKSSRESEQVAATQPPRNQRSRVTNYCRLRKSRYVSVGNAHRIFDFICKTAEA